MHPSPPFTLLAMYITPSTTFGELGSDDGFPQSVVVAAEDEPGGESSCSSTTTAEIEEEEEEGVV